MKYIMKLLGKQAQQTIFNQLTKFNRSVCALLLRGIRLGSSLPLS
jgi:hypothetical protein